MGKRQISLPVSSITGKSTTQAARSLTAMKTQLEIKVRELKNKDKLTAREEARLEKLENQLKDVKAEIKDEAVKAGRSLAQKGRDSKKFKGYDPSKDPMAEKERLEPRLSDLTPLELKAILAKQDEAVKKAESKRNARAKGGVMGFNTGGMPSRKGNFDMRKGGMFMKGTK
jgi:hypothetical protein|tara:strand:+ start:347 stop:859 length:513 start_codon:yes stop_codon:yes gene_type:complete